MKTLKAFVVLALFMITSVAFAQQGPGGRQQRSVAERAKSETERLVTALSLDADQTAKILAISLKYATKDSVRTAELRSSGVEIDREKMMAERTVREGEKSTEFQAILKTDQIAKYKTYLEERQQRQGQGGQRPQ